MKAQLYVCGVGGKTGDKLSSLSLGWEETSSGPHVQNLISGCEGVPALWLLHILYFLVTPG